MFFSTLNIKCQILKCHEQPQVIFGVKFQFIIYLHEIEEKMKVYPNCVIAQGHRPSC